MKQLITILLAIFFIVANNSCNKETEPGNNDLTGKGKVTFAVNQLINQSSLKSISNEKEIFSAVITIIDEQENTIVESKQLVLYKFGEQYITEPVSLQPGNYKLTKFIITDQNSNALYATPIENSAKAYLVNDPLPIEFNVIKEKVTKLTPEVIVVAENASMDFGYETFSFDIVELFDFLLSVFIYNDSINNFELTNCNIIILNGEGNIIYEDSLQAVTNQIILREDIGSYTINITKVGYSDYTEIFTTDSLKSHSQEPLIIILNKGNLLVLQPDSVTGKDARISSSLPNDNRGSCTHSYVYAWTNSGIIQYIRSLLDFGITDLIPTGTIIKSAKLYLYYFPYAPNEVHSGENQFYIKNIVESWEEYGVTWNNQPATTEHNQVLVPKSSYNNQDYEIDITALCQDAIDNPDSIFGIMLQLKTEQIYRMACFASSDNPDSTKHPKLIIEF